MTLTKKIYLQLSDIFKQLDQDPESLPVFPFDQWPENSSERTLLEGIQSLVNNNDDIQLDSEAVKNEETSLYKKLFDSDCNGVIILDMETGIVIEANPTASSMYGYSRDEFVGLHTTEFLHYDSYDIYDKCLKEVKSGHEFNGVFLNIRRDCSAFKVDATISQIYFNQQPSLMLIVNDMSDQTQNMLNEQILQQRVQIRTYELSTLLDISQTLSSTLDIDPELILDQLNKIISFTHAGLFTIQESSLVALAFCGPESIKQCIPLEIRLDGPEILNILFNGHQTIRIGNVTGGDPTAIFLRSLLKNQASVLLEGIHSWMWVPLVVKDRILGGLGIAKQEPNYFTTHHADLALTVANQAATTLANAELYEHAQMYATLQERQRLARNLHDAVNQSLFSASLIAEVLPRLWEQDQQEARGALEDLRRLTHGAMAEMRMMMAELRPMALTDVKIGDMLRLLGDSFIGRTNIPVEILIEGDISVPAEVQMVFYRLCQESLSNIAKHSQADKVEIKLGKKDNTVNLCISDNGCGFDPQQVPAGHYGLSIMRERAESIEAAFSIETQPGVGTKVDISWKEDPEWRH